MWVCFVLKQKPLFCEELRLFLFSELGQFLGSMHHTCHSQFPSELTIAEEECNVNEKDNMRIFSR
jgi:hypothetical protein